ncbi:hypothetical protein GGX14DRAFT_543304 [Mycena pura]|uniref:Uncharacterized protein n=1 Tax=Mycena pura TaxID=153505 RepID=A0AAD6YGX3_9AGAR|nr:hypothetical protein GGX14DRAFT_543304 [Mycena pura]
MTESDRLSDSVILLTIHLSNLWLRWIVNTDALPPGCASLRLPRLETLNTLVPYLLHILAPAPAADGACELKDDDDAAAPRFPCLALIELRPHALLPDALRLLARTHAPRSLLPAHFAAAWWSPQRFPAVRVLTLNECRVVPEPAALLARVFPALAKVKVNHCSWASRGDVDVSRRQIEREQRAFVEQVKAANPGVHTVIFDGKEPAV